MEETQLMWIPVHKAWQLNDRDGGALQALDKQETADKYGKDQGMYHMYTSLGFTFFVYTVVDFVILG